MLDAVWRAEDEALLERLEDEEVLDRLYRYHVGTPSADAAPLHPRAAGMIAAVRRAGGTDVVTAAASSGDVAPLARWIESRPLGERSPEFVHHFALYFGKVARVLESTAPEAGSTAWTRSLAGWLALGTERTYLAAIEAAVLGTPDARGSKASPAPPPEKIPIERIVELGRQAEAACRDLAPEGRAAMLALRHIDDAIRASGAGPDLVRNAVVAAERGCNAALDGALAVVGEALDEANVRGELMSEGRRILLRALDVWRWSEHDEQVEQFVVDKLAMIGWELYRARSWDALRYLLDPFRPLVERLADRVERDPTKVAFAAGCAQMFVFLSDVEGVGSERMRLAERALRICPTHRNGRLVVASLLCDDAIKSMRTMLLFARKDELARVEAMIARAETLYPQSGDLPEARAMLERLKAGRFTV